MTHSTSGGAATTQLREAPKMLRTRQFFGYGAGDTANNLAFSLAVSFLALYYTDVALISPATVGTIFLVMRIIDAFTDIIAGSVVDRTSTRWGKFRPFILFGSVPLIILAVLCFSMPQALWGTPGAVIWASVTYFLMGSVAFTFVNIPYGSLASAMTQNRGERAKLAVFRTMGAAVMQVGSALVISPFLQTYRGDPQGLQSALTRTLIILGAIAFLLYLFTFFTARENVERKVARVGLKDALRTMRSNKALVMLAITSVVYLVGLFGAGGVIAYYGRDVLGNGNYVGVALALQFGMILVIGWFIPTLVRRLGKPRLFQIGAVLGAIGGMILFFAPADQVWIAIAGFILFGTSSGIVNTVMWNMEADTVEYGEWKTGLRTEGTTYAVFSFMRKLGQAIGGALGLWVIGYAGYVGGEVVQSESALVGIRAAAGILPCVMFIAAAILLFFYPLTDKNHTNLLQVIQQRRDEEEGSVSAQITKPVENTIN